MRLSKVILPVLILAGAAPALASESDYLPDSTSWNGLGDLAGLARQEGLGLRLARDLDWGAVPRGSTLLVLYPRAELDPVEVVAFLRDGGRLLLADDFGQAGPLLRVFDIELVQGQAVRGPRLHRGNPSLPIATRSGASHLLNSGVDTVITNHPAYFRSRLPTLLGFAEGQRQLLVAGEVESGRLVALADPSVLINAMLAFPGNRRLAQNLLRYLRPADGETTLTLVTGRVRASGTYGSAGAGGGAGSADRLAAELNAFIEQINSFALVEAGLRAVALLCAGLAILALVLQLPMPRRDLLGHWARPEGISPSPVEEDAEHYRRAARGATYPAAVLREEIEEALGEIVGGGSPLSTVHPRWIVSRVHELAGPQAAAACRRLLASLRRVPALPRPAGASPMGGVSARHLALIYEQSRALFSLLGTDPLPALGAQKDHART